MIYLGIIIDYIKYRLGSLVQIQFKFQVQLQMPMPNSQNIVTVSCYNNVSRPFPIYFAIFTFKIDELYNRGDICSNVFFENNNL